LSVEVAEGLDLARGEFVVVAFGAQPPNEGAQIVPKYVDVVS